MCLPMTIDERTSIHLADLFSALGDPTRLLILSALLEHEMSVGEVAEVIGISEIGGVTSVARLASDAARTSAQGGAAGFLLCR